MINLTGLGIGLIQRSMHQIKPAMKAMINIITTKAMRSSFSPGMVANMSSAVMVYMYLAVWVVSGSRSIFYALPDL